MNHNYKLKMCCIYFFKFDWSEADFMENVRSQIPHKLGSKF